MKKIILKNYQKLELSNNNTAKYIYNNILESEEDVAPLRLEDSKRISSVLKRYRSAISTIKESEQIWKEYSYTYAAGWLGLPADDEDLLKILDKTIVYMNCMPSAYHPDTIIFYIY